MSKAPEFETFTVQGQRIPVARDLGPLCAGDYVLVVAGVVVALDRKGENLPRLADLSGKRPPQTVIDTVAESLPVPSDKGRRRRKVDVNGVLAELAEFRGPVRAMDLSDALGLRRDNRAGRAKVGIILRRLIADGTVRRVETARHAPTYERVDQTTRTPS